MAARYRQYRAFTVLELLVSIAVIALLIGLLLPLLIGARNVGYTAVCANNLRQINIGWQSYLQSNKDVFPRSPSEPEWRYGGAAFVGADHHPILDSSRPINKFIAADDSTMDAVTLAMLFHCPADEGVYPRGQLDHGRHAMSILDRGTCFLQFGTSYRANPNLLSSTEARIDRLDRPIAMHEIQTDPSRLLLTGDAAWYYATRDSANPEAHLEASWHSRHDTGNMLAIDGSIRLIDFANWPSAQFALNPRPDLGN